jgi:hypothetical protein
MPDMPSTLDPARAQRLMLRVEVLPSTEHKSDEAFSLGWY